MKAKEDTVRVWVGLDLLQAQMMKQMLIDSGIECLADRDMGVIPAGEFGEMGLWVSQSDEAQARTLLERMEEEMSASLDNELPDPEQE